MRDLFEYLSANPYPGRGIVVGNDGEHTVIAYFIMGRSENSRNRIFVAEGENLRTRAFDESKVTDPSLIIYYPVRTFGGCTLVTNGDQTDTIADFLKKGGTFEDALRSRCFEPDKPNYTPRISAIVFPDGSFKMSILKAGDEGGSLCLRYFFEYERPKNGFCRIIHTYRTDGNPIPPFEGEPVEFPIRGDIDEFSQKLWRRFDRENKVSLFVRYIDKNGQFRDRIINKNS